jgi:RecJ-like exonuclease
MTTTPFKRLLSFLFTSIWAIHVGACSMCLDTGSIETREPCKLCAGTGKTWETISVQCPKCQGTGWDTFKLQGTQYGAHKTVRCRRCAGTGSLSDKRSNTCTQCEGRGFLVKRIICPSCKGQSAGNAAAAPAASTPANTPANNVSIAQVEACTRCDKDGNTSSVVVCTRCEKGFVHRKENEKFYCRKCGKECKDRFSPCACGQPDCPDCKGEYNKTVKKVCDLCGGDKIITPLEREKFKKQQAQ